MLSYGFYNSQNGDRMYSADDFAGFLDGIVYDGIYNAIGDCFLVETTNNPNELKVGPGRAWFNRTWTFNDTNYILSPTYVDEGVVVEGDVPLPSNTGYRIDAVIIEVNKDLRENYIKMIQGEEVSLADYEAGQRPVRPHLLGKNPDGSKDTEYEGNVFQYALAYIPRPISSVQDTIQNSDIVNVVGDETGQTPMVSALAIAGIPSGGKTGQVLAKFSTENGNVGWYNIHKLPTEKWYLAEGLTEEDVIAAFKFVEVASETDALRSVNEGTQYLLSKSGSNVTWTAEKGFYFPNKKLTGLLCSDLNNVHGSVNSMFFGFSGVINPLTSSYGYGGIMLRTEWRNFKCIAICPHYSGATNSVPRHSIANYSNTAVNVPLYTTPENFDKGVLSGNFKANNSFDFYHNGNALSISNTNSFNQSGFVSASNIVFGHFSEVNGNDGNNVSVKPFYMTAVVLFNKILTNDQHLEISENILKLGGGTQ